MKYISLIFLVGQNASVVILTRYAEIVRNRDENNSTDNKDARFLRSSAVFLAEVIKLVTCLIMTFYEQKFNFKNWSSYLFENLIKNYKDTIRTAVPAFIYVIQNIILYVAIGNLPAAEFQVAYQLKLLTTAFFSIILLKRKINLKQWLSLVLLFAGVSIVEVSTNDSEKHAEKVEQSQFLGLISVICACLCSGFAGVYFEKILKISNNNNDLDRLTDQPKTTLWTRNIQLGSFCTLLSCITCFTLDGAKIKSHPDGLLQGYNNIIWYTVLMHAFGGLLVALVVKYADSILKGFACAISVVISTIMANVLFEYQITIEFVVGTFMVCSSVFIYSYFGQSHKK